MIMGKEFLAFLKQYGVIGLAIGVIIGGKANALVTAIVDNLIMPLIGLILPGGDWRTLAIGPITYGPILGALVDFLIVAYIIFWFAKKVLKEDTVAKK
jgi:large conductance mechanosensitive channel